MRDRSAVSALVSISALARSGRLIVFAFAVMTALKEVLTGSLVRNHDPLLLVLVAFTCSTALFALLRHKGSPGGRVRLRDHAVPLLALNLTTVLGWGTVYYALQFLAPAVVATLAVATLPLFSTLLYRLITGAQPSGRIDFIAALGLLSAAIWLAVVSWEGGGIVIAGSRAELVVAFLACVMSGLGMAASNILAARLYRAGLQPMDIMATRFILLTGLAGALWLAQAEAAAVSAGHLAVLVGYGIGAIAMPLFILQIGLSRASPVEAGAIISLSPVFVVIFQSFDPQVEIGPMVVAAILLAVVIVIGQILLRDRLARRMAVP